MYTTHSTHTTHSPQSECAYNRKGVVCARCAQCVSVSRCVFFSYSFFHFCLFFSVVVVVALGLLSKFILLKLLCSSLSLCRSNNAHFAQHIEPSKIIIIVTCLMLENDYRILCVVVDHQREAATALNQIRKKRNAKLVVEWWIYTHLASSLVVYSV